MSSRRTTPDASPTQQLPPLHPSYWPRYTFDQPGRPRSIPPQYSDATEPGASTQAIPGSIADSVANALRRDMSNGYVAPNVTDPGGSPKRRAIALRSQYAPENGYVPEGGYGQEDGYDHEDGHIPEDGHAPVRETPSRDNTPTRNHTPTRDYTSKRDYTPRDNTSAAAHIQAPMPALAILPRPYGSYTMCNGCHGTGWILTPNHHAPVPYPTPGPYHAPAQRRANPVYATQYASPTPARQPEPLGYEQQQTAQHYHRRATSVSTHQDPNPDYASQEMIHEDEGAGPYKTPSPERRRTTPAHESQETIRDGADPYVTPTPEYRRTVPTYASQPTTPVPIRARNGNTRAFAAYAAMGPGSYTAPVPADPGPLTAPTQLTGRLQFTAPESRKRRLVSESSGSRLSSTAEGSIGPDRHARQSTSNQIERKGKGKERTLDGVRSTYRNM